MREKFRLAAIFALFLACPADAKKPRNPRWGRRAPAAKPAPATSSATAVSVSTGPASSWDAPRLAGGRWSPEVRAAIEALIAARGKGAPGYDPLRPPVAVLPWDDACVKGSVSETLFLRLVTRVDFKVDDEFWDIVPVAYGRQPIRAAYQQFIRLPRAVWNEQPTYHQFRRGLLDSYFGLLAGVGRKEARAYMTRLLVGYKEDEFLEYAQAAVKDEKAETRAFELVPREPGDPDPLRVRRGLRVVPEMRDLAAKLLEAGFDLWVADDVPQGALVAAAADYGVDKTRVLGIRSAPDGARMSAGVLKPVPVRGGKTEAVSSALGRPPDFVLGRDADDADLLSYGSGLRVAMGGDPSFERVARERGWLVQPPR